MVGIPFRKIEIDIGLIFCKYLQRDLDSLTEQTFILPGFAQNTLLSADGGGEKGGRGEIMGIKG